ncbi:MAG: NADH-quinone oxidoreductase subunit A [Desulfuromonas sp.]
MQSSLQYASLIVYTLVAVLLVGAMLLATWWFGTGTAGHNKKTPYESGIIPSGSARLRLYIPFYLLAIFFIVFDVESAFIFTWAVVWDQLGLAGLLHITFFIVALLLGLVWIWLKGGLEWGPSRMREERGDNEA